MEAGQQGVLRPDAMGAPVGPQHGLIDEGAEDVPIGDNNRPVVTLLHQFPVDGSNLIHHLIHLMLIVIR